MRKSQVLAGGLASLFLMTTMPAGGEAAPKKDRLRGSGRIEDPGGIDPPFIVIDVRVNAQSGSLGEDPKGWIVATESIVTGQVTDIRARLTCLAVASDIPSFLGGLADIAVAEGVITRSSTADVAEQGGVTIVVRETGGGQDFVYSRKSGPSAECPDPAAFVDTPFTLPNVETDFEVIDAAP